MLRCSPGGNNANALLAFGVGYIQHNVTFSHADENKTLLAIVFTIIKALDSKWVVENRLCQIETHAVSLQVGLGFGVVPFKSQFS